MGKKSGTSKTSSTSKKSRKAKNKSKASTQKSLRSTNDTKEARSIRGQRSQIRELKSVRQTSKIALSIKKSEQNISVGALAEGGEAQPASTPPPGAPAWGNHSDPAHARVKRDYGPGKIELPALEEVKIKKEEDLHQALMNTLKWQASLLNYYRSHIITRYLVPLQQEISRTSGKDVDLRERLEFTRRGFPITRPEKMSKEKLVERLSKMAACWRLFFLINIQESLLVWEKGLLRFLGKTEIRAKWKVINKFDLAEQFDSMCQVTLSLAEIWDLPAQGAAAPHEEPAVDMPMAMPVMMPMPMPMPEAETPAPGSEPQSVPVDPGAAPEPSAVIPESTQLTEAGGDERKEGGADMDEDLVVDGAEQPATTNKPDTISVADRLREEMEISRIRDTESRIRYFQMAMTGLLREFRGIMMRFDAKFSFTMGYELPTTPKQILKKINALPPQYRLAELVTLEDKTRELLLRYDDVPPGVFAIPASHHHS